MKLDKRTKEYKIWKNNQEIEQANKPTGLGDTVEKILNSDVLAPITNIIKKAIFKDPTNCGCEDRKKALNNLFPYSKKVNWLSENDYIWVEEYMSRMHPTKVVHEDLKRISEIHASVFGHKFVMLCNCNGKRVKEWREDILKVYSEIKKEQY